MGGRAAESGVGVLYLPRLVRLLIYAVLLSFLVLFHFYPLASILTLSFAPQGQVSLEPLSRLFQTSRYLETLWFTIWQATLSTLLTLLLALPASYVFARYDFPGKSVIQALTTVPFVLPTMVVSLAFTALLGPRGLANLALMRVLGLDQPPLDLQHTLAIIVLAHVFYNYTLVLRIVGTFWSNLSPQLEEAARMLGSSRWRAFAEVTLPLLVPSLTAAAVLVFIFDFTSFGVILVLGGPRFATLEVEIYRQTVHYLNLPLAAALSVIQILFTFGLMVVYTRLQASTTLPVELRSRRAVQRRPQGWREAGFVAANVVFMVVLLVTPLVALVERSLTLDGGVSLTFYRELFRNPRGSVFYVPPVAAVRNSVGFALATVVLSVILGLMAAAVLSRRSVRASREVATSSMAGQGGMLAWLPRMLDPILMLPLGTSAVTLGLGYIVALDEPPLNLRTSPLLVVLAHTLVALPFVVRSVLPAVRSIQPQLREAAAVMGASSWRVWLEVDLPIVARAMVVGAVFAFTVSMGEFGATSLIARPERPTMPVAIFRFLGRPGAVNYGQALAMSTLLMLVCTGGFLVIERFRVGGMGEF
ncbi:MAG: iron ABC transporter permease [Chloroflexota bacterium]|nr:iron ABC transporter permease [Chloroflexota bacterium]